MTRVQPPLGWPYLNHKTYTKREIVPKDWFGKKNGKFYLLRMVLITDNTETRYYRIAGNFHGVQIFAFFEGRVVNAKIKTGINSHAPVYAGAKPIGGCGLLALTRKFLLRALGAK